MKYLALVLLLSLMAGCSALNLLFDERQNFINARDSEVGEPLKDVLKTIHYYNYWEGNQHYYGAQQYEVIALESGNSEYIFKSGECQWALEVEPSDNKVGKWRFIANEEQCTWKKFYEGAW